MDSKALTELVSRAKAVLAGTIRDIEAGLSHPVAVQSCLDTLDRIHREICTRSGVALENRNLDPAVVDLYARLALDDLFLSAKHYNDESRARAAFWRKMRQVTVPSLHPG